MPNLAIAPSDPGSVSHHDVTELLDAWSAGDRGALDQAMPLVLGDLRRLARSFMARQSPGHTLEPTALVHEAYLRLVGHRTARWESRVQFFAYLSTVMRRILINHARDARVAKKGGDAAHLPLNEALDATAAGVFLPWSGDAEWPGGVDILDLDRALEGLGAVDPRQARIVELRYFGGLTIEETARVLEVSTRTVKREWHSARLWLLRTLGGACDASEVA